MTPLTWNHNILSQHRPTEPASLQLSAPSFIHPVTQSSTSEPKHCPKITPGVLCPWEESVPLGESIPKATPFCQGHSAIFKLHMWIGMESNVCCKEQSCTSHFPSNLSGSSLLLLLCCIDWKPSSTQEFVHASLYSRSCVCTETPCMISTSIFFLLIGWKERLKWSEPPDMFQSCSSLACRAWKTLTFFTLKKWYFLSFLTEGEICPGNGGCHFFLSLSKQNP